MKKAAIVCIVMFGIGYGFTSPSFGAEEELQERMEKLEKAMESSWQGALGEWAKRVTLSGAVEVEAWVADRSDDWEDEDASDADLATADLFVDVQASDWVKGHMALSWDCEDDNCVGIDEAHITLGGTENFPAYLKAGRLYVPFGDFETHMISDPLTLEIGEIRDGALEIGVDIAGFYAAVYAFNGDVDEAEDDDAIDRFGANLGYALEREGFNLNVGMGYVNNVLESGMSDLLEGDLKDYVAGIAGHAVIGFGPADLIMEYVTALDEIENAEGWTHEEPGAWNLEICYTFDVSEKEITLAAAYQGTEECAGFLPETRIMGSAGISLTDHLGLALEYAHDKDYDEEDGGTDETRNALTLQLAFEF